MTEEVMDNNGKSKAGNYPPTFPKFFPCYLPSCFIKQRWKKDEEYNIRINFYILKKGCQAKHQTTQYKNDWICGFKLIGKHNQRQNNQD